MKVLATIQARMGSTRLPGKVLREAGGQPLLLTQVRRLEKSRCVDEVVIATSVSSADDEIEDFALRHGIGVFRGSELDVLGRVSDCLALNASEIHVECFGDSPMVDPNIVDAIYDLFRCNLPSIDIISNSSPQTYPVGVEVNIYKAQSLLEVNQLVADDDPLREHVGFNFRRFPERFSFFSVEAPGNLNYPNLILEVDYAEDLSVLDRILTHFRPRPPEDISTEEIIEACLQNPALSAGNESLERKWRNVGRA